MDIEEKTEKRKVLRREWKVITSDSIRQTDVTARLYVNFSEMSRILVTETAYSRFTG